MPAIRLIGYTSKERILGIDEEGRFYAARYDERKDEPIDWTPVILPDGRHWQVKPKEM